MDWNLWSSRLTHPFQSAGITSLYLLLGYQAPRIDCTFHWVSSKANKCNDCKTASFPYSPHSVMHHELEDNHCAYFLALLWKLSEIQHAVSFQKMFIVIITIVSTIIINIPSMTNLLHSAIDFPYTCDFLCLFVIASRHITPDTLLSANNTSFHSYQPLLAPLSISLMPYFNTAVFAF